MNIEEKLEKSIIAGLSTLYGQEVLASQVQLQKTKKEFQGHLTLVVFPFLRASKKSPEQTAQEIGEYLKENEPLIASFNVIKGFLNLTIASTAWVELLDIIHEFPAPVPQLTEQLQIVHDLLIELVLLSSIIPEIIQNPLSGLECAGLVERLRDLHLSPVAVQSLLVLLSW